MYANIRKKYPVHTTIEENEKNQHLGDRGGRGLSR